jgi:DMSO/TMAO reductase YedYZ molybdopterin-dependent catalytic subunit
LSSHQESPSLRAAVIGGAAAAMAAGVAMAVVRWALLVRTVPERVMEGLLLLVPLDLFELGLLGLGIDAKRYALYGAIAGTLVVLGALGTLVLRRRWPTGAILALGLGLWLFVMLVLLPLTSAGVFAMGLLDGTRANVGGYLTVALVYAATLAAASALIGGPPPATASRREVPEIWAATPAAAQALILAQQERIRDLETRLAQTSANSSRPPSTDPPQAPPRRKTPPTGRKRGGQPGHRGTFRALWTSAPSRRTALLMMGGAFTSYVATLAAVRWGPGTQFQRVIVLDPQQPVPSGGIDPAHPHPEAISTSPPSATQPIAAAGLTDPPPARVLQRDQDGAVLPSGRRPGQLAELITNNDDFYIVTKNAAGDPSPSAAAWRLVIDGEVGRTVQLDYRSLRNLPSIEVTKTLECISNLVAKCELAPFGCDLISTARWRGVRVSDLLKLAGDVKPGVVSLAVIAADEFSTALPIEVALAPDTLLVYEMNGQVLPREHGYPARVLVPGRYGMKNAKWVVALRAMTREFVDWYGQRNWSRQAIVKTMTRIDYPAPGAVLPPGEHRIAGIAYAGDRGVAKVEFSADGGASWEVAELLEPPPGWDTWVRWEGRFHLPDHTTLTLVTRATDGTGALQIEAFSLPQPDGASGWFSVEVQAPRA